MNDLQIDYFMAVATNLSFTKTSEELFVSQPAISKQISLMENIQFVLEVWMQKEIREKNGP